MKKALPIGVDDFEKMITNNYYYVDKSLFIKEILNKAAIATLIPRPRRFGKTLNMTMLRCFFEKRENSRIQLFDNLAIAKHSDIMAHQGQYPVVFLTLKFIDGLTWDDCLDKLKLTISQEYRRHQYLLDGSLLDKTQKKDFEEIIERKASNVLYEVSLKNLIVYLADYHKKSPIVLVDEYDVPIHAGSRNNYFKNVASFIKSFLGDGLKGNDMLGFAVLTGCLRVAKESIFTGLNHLDVCTFLNKAYEDKFGLLEDEVSEMLAYYNLQTNADEVRSWYNGYTSGSVTVYNPWSIINLVKQNGELKPYWINTSTNDIIKSLITGGATGIEEEIEALIARKSITKEICEDIAYSDINQNSHSLWNFLFFSGYLTLKNARNIDDIQHADFYIPNTEVASFFKSTVLTWIEKPVGEQEFNYMLKSLISGDITTFRDLFSMFVLNSFSYFDISGTKPERFYHAFVLGMLVSLADRYEIKSNRESGYGRYDVMLIPHDITKLGIVIEFKKVSAFAKETLKQAAENALKQIDEKQYVQEIISRGINSIMRLAIVFSGKNVLIEAKGRPLL